MDVLLLKLAGPLQSWGDTARFVRRTTRREPTKSGVVGILASALGRTRTCPVDDLAQLEMGVRTEQRGKLVRDFQTERSLDGKRTMPLSHRYYLSDACFLVALGGDDALLKDLEGALRAPRWPLYLGRRSCPPSEPVLLELSGKYRDVRDALEHEPWHASARYRSLNGIVSELEVACDARDGEMCESQEDYPLSFSGEGRRYACRPVRRYCIPNPDAQGESRRYSSSHGAARFSAAHDPMAWF